MSKPEKKTSAAVLVVTPLLMLMICGAVTAVAGIVPYNKLTTYLNIAFSDDMRATNTASDDIVVNTELHTYEKDPTVQKSTEGEVEYPEFAQQYATLECKAIDLYVPVYWGTDEKLLKNGACQLTSSAVIGEKGNVVIDAHVNTFFADLDKLKEGDEIILKTSYGEFRYKVKKQAVFEKTDKKYISPSQDDKLTLYTCVKQVLGSSTQRLAVICELTEKAFYN